jgi:4-amino-4-deoxy-L-arabinose transferase-like glycosyltransferase
MFRSYSPLPVTTRTWVFCFSLATAMLLLSRLLLMWLAPLADTTEARYGELARQTIMHGYWLMPHMDAATPFFAKPPLSTWTSAASMGLFGVNEFAARLPALLVSALTAWLTVSFAGYLGVRRRWLVVPVLFACPLFFISAGAVMTDAVQMTIVWAAQVCAWRALDDSGAAGKRWRLGFWALIGFGALSKGLATWALIGLPIFAYAVWRKQLPAVLRALPDWLGIALAGAIFLPWYIAAERGYPGFLHYFIVGEHFSRFLVPGWTGDRYGTAHRQPIGAIWVFWVGAVLPWLFIFWQSLASMLKRREATAAQAYLWCCVLVPLLFFTFSRNIIWTYALTAVPPFAVLVTQWLDGREDAALRRAGQGLLAYALLACAAVPLILKQTELHSDRALMRAFQQLAPMGTALAYSHARPSFSAAFYGREAIRSGAPAPSDFRVVDNDDAAAKGPGALYANKRQTLIGRQ